MKTILVTGATGYIGSHTCVELLNRGYNVVGFDNFMNSGQDVLEKISKITGKSIKFYEADMRDKEKTEIIFKENKIDCVIHFASSKAVGESVVKPLEYYENNVGGTFVLLEAMKKYDCNNIIFSSSATVYGMNNESPYTENMPVSATNPYGYCKVFIEQILRDVCTANKGFSAVLLRYFNPVGAHLSGLIGEKPNGIPNNIMPYICNVATGKSPSLNIFGNDYDTPDGTGVRDYIHVLDLVDGHINAIEYSLNNKGSVEINLGTEVGTSVLELVKAYEKASNQQIPYKIVERRAGDIGTCYANSALAKELLGWSAKYTLEDMCRDSYAFIIAQNSNN